MFNVVAVILIVVRDLRAARSLSAAVVNSCSCLTFDVARPSLKANENHGSAYARCTRSPADLLR